MSNLRTASCEEASVLSKESYIPCGAPATKLVYHRKDRRTYPMCPPCASHNIRNRGGEEVVLCSSKP
jgi:Zn finger protein HypA/HybF involved in hydrogenase expression